MDLAIAILPDPEGPFSPGQSRVSAAPRRRDGGEHAAGRGIDLLDAILGELKQVLAIEGGAGMRGDVDERCTVSRLRVNGRQRVSGGKPDALAVVGDAVHMVGAGERAVLANNLGG